MKLNERRSYNLVVRVEDYVVNQTYGFHFLNDPIEPKNFLDLDAFEFYELYKLMCDMKDKIEKERMKK